MTGKETTLSICVIGVMLICFVALIGLYLRAPTEGFSHSKQLTERDVNEPNYFSGGNLEEDDEEPSNVDYGRLTRSIQHKMQGADKILFEGDLRERYGEDAEWLAETIAQGHY